MTINWKWRKRVNRDGTVPFEQPPVHERPDDEQRSARLVKKIRLVDLLRRSGIDK